MLFDDVYKSYLLDRYDIQPVGKPIYLSYNYTDTEGEQRCINFTDLRMPRNTKVNVRKTALRTIKTFEQMIAAKFTGDFECRDGEIFTLKDNEKKIVKQYKSIYGAELYFKRRNKPVKEKENKHPYIIYKQLDGSVHYTILENKEKNIVIKLISRGLTNNDFIQDQQYLTRIYACCKDISKSVFIKFINYNDVLVIVDKTNSRVVKRSILYKTLRKTIV